jgi:hypothetical protein
MEIKFSIFVGKVQRYEKLTTIRFWTHRLPPNPGAELSLVSSHDSAPIAKGLCTLVMPIIMTRDNLYIYGRRIPPEALMALAMADGFESLNGFWTFFHLELDNMQRDVAAGWIIKWEPLTP